MRNKTILLLCSALLSGSLSLSLLGCGGCASTQPRSGAASPSFQGIEILPEEKELSPAAKDTYAYLLYMQALADEDEELLLQAAQQMTGGTLPAKAWLEGALWLDSRRSEKVLPLLELSLLMPAAGQGGRAAARFKQAPEQLYHQLVQLLSVPEEREETP